MRKMRVWKMWALVDRTDTYLKTVHTTKTIALREKSEWEYLKDAKWVVIRVEVRELAKRRKK
jgi:hypothetical protein